MKSILLATAICFGAFIPATVLGQKITEKDLIGSTWKLKIDIESALEEAEEEVEEEGNIIAEVILSGVSGMVKGIINNIDVYFEFEKNNELRVYVEAFDEEDVEYTYWEINKYGELVIDDTEHFSTENDGYWIYEDGIFVYLEDDHDRDDPKIFLVEVR